MSLWALFAWSALLLVGPWTLMPARGPLPEIHGPIRSLWWLNVMYCAAWHRLESSGMAPLPERGPAILVANHTCGVDPMVLQATCGRLLGFLVAKEIFDIWLIRPFCRLLGCIPVRRDGHDLAATRAALRALKEGRVVPIFPEGRIIPTSGRELGEPKTGVAFIVLHARVPVIPAYISGTPPTNNIWKAALTPSKARVTYGPPIDFSDAPAGPPYAKATLAEVADRLMAAIRDLQARAWAEPEGARPRPPLESLGDARRPESRPGSVPGGRPAVRTS
ncbi:MAG TPA: lysophospholipid acyltransferase family protein [Isosphaeraceae bacterium]|nr:lysophospholipid acyltransferase family protein [Isosphaeraceae bacterium]